MSNATHSTLSGSNPMGFGTSTFPLARSIAVFLGVVFLLVTVAGFINSNLLGAHLSPVHNTVHLVSGTLALLFAAANSVTATRLFNAIFGMVYMLLGVAGFAFGSSGMSAAGHVGDDSRLLTVIPNVLELGTMDHCIHIVVGLLFLIGSVGLIRSSRSVT